MHTTVVLGCPIEQVADSELVPTPDESLIISLVSPRLLSVRVPQQKVSVSNPKTKPARQGMRRISLLQKTGDASLVDDDLSS